jgi:hypothetical protein
MADQSLPLKISIAPFPEGFDGDMDETFQQACILMSATVEGQFLTGLILPPGSTLPSTDQGPIAMGGVWYFWDPVTGQYLPQSLTARAARNYVKNGSCQVQQTGAAPALVAGVNKTYDMCLCRMTTAGVLAIAADVGPFAGADYDTCPAAIKYTVGTTAPTLGTTDLYSHEHLIEGSDLAPIQGEILSLSFLCWVNQPGTYSAYLASGARDESYCATFTMPTANTWTRIKIQNIPAIPTSGTWSYGEGVTGMYVGVTMACGSQWTTTNTAKWNAGFFGAGTGQSNMCSVTNNQMKITAVRLEASPQCGYATINSFEADLHDAIRYYYTNFNYQTTNAGTWGLNLYAHQAGFAMGSMLFPRRMAKVPTVTLYSASTFTINTIRNLTTGVDVTAFGTPAASQKGVAFGAAITTPASAKSDGLAAFVTADARLT